MSENSKIEWCDHTFNPWEGCQKVGSGCDHCYAERRNARFAGGNATNWGPGAPRRRTSAANWLQPIRWNLRHAKFFAKHARRQRVFCASLADVFDNAVAPTWRTELFNLIYATPDLDWLLLTKRIGNVREMLLEPGMPHRMPPNIWLGATIVNQAEADRDIPKLLAVPARVRFLSMEPLLGPVNLPLVNFHCDVCGGTGILARWPKGTCHYCKGRGNIPAISTDPQFGVGSTPMRSIDWVIVGGESGAGARPMSTLWARSLRDQCDRVGVPFLFKQWGEWAPAGMRVSGEPGRFAFGDYEFDPSAFHHVDNYPRQFAMFGARCVMERAGKRKAGRLLDGREHSDFPGERG